MQAKQVSIAAIICAAGSSRRFAARRFADRTGGVKKEYLPLEEPAAEVRMGSDQRSIGPPPEKSLTVLGAAARAFASSPLIGLIVIVVPPGPKEAEEAALASLPEELRSEVLLSNPGHRRIFFVSGGPTRRASVYNALLFLESFHPSHVLIHDGARPWIKPELIERIVDAAIKFEAVIPTLPLTETPKELEDGFIKRHLRRGELCTAQTPQGFKFPEILKAHKKAEEREKAARVAGEVLEYTDDAEVWGEFIGKVAVIPGDPANRKVTYPEDLINKSLTGHSDEWRK